jgi:hypothetical protein
MALALPRRWGFQSINCRSEKPLKSYCTETGRCLYRSGLFQEYPTKTGTEIEEITAFLETTTDNQPIMTPPVSRSRPMRRPNRC